jgi:hypothetical protein
MVGRTGCNLLSYAAITFPLDFFLGEKVSTLHSIGRMGKVIIKQKQ